jgi:archaellum component FlaC
MHKLQGVELEVRRLHDELQMVITLVEFVSEEGVLEDYHIFERKLEPASSSEIHSLRGPGSYPAHCTTHGL